MFKRIDHVEILPSDMERTIAFYRDVIGFTLASRHAIDMPPLREIVYMTLGDSMIELLGMQAPVNNALDQSQVGYRLLALEVDDMERTIADLAAKGVPVVWGPVNIGDAIRAEIRDPDGLPIEMRQWLKK